jgi:hypothetical protein
MSRPIFSTAAAVAVDSALAQPRQAQQRRFCELEPGLRLIEGRVLYSAAWLDHSTSGPRSSDAEACSEGRPKGGLGG